MISVVVPAWNAGEWLAEALESLQAQGEAFGECIVVDDGSTDSTPEIARMFAARDSRFRLVSIPNSGPSVARNVGLELVTGSWLAFMDADDVWLPGAFDRLLQGASEAGEDCGIIEGNVVRWKSGVPLAGMMARADAAPGGLRMLSGRSATLLSLYQTGVEASLYAKLYRPPLWDGIRFPEGELYEDLSVFHRVAMRARVYARLDSDVYAYRLRPESLIHAFNPRRLIVLGVTDRIRRRFAGDPELLRAATDRRLAASFNMLGLMLANPSAADPVNMADCRGFIRRHAAASLRDSGARLKNRLGAMAALLLPRRLLDMMLRRVYR
ncbi:MAG: glycosyltransferase family 2 protein [Bacteroides sp.]|nr:glycosyltransferase family 2 protein [Bacteroides sp.]